MTTRVKTDQTSAQRNAAEVARTRVTKPLIDYGSLTIADTDNITHSRGNILDGTPFVEWVKASKDGQTAKTITVPNAAVDQTKNLLRAAGTRLGLGVTVDTVASKRAGHTEVKFQAKDRRKYNGRKPKTAAA